MNSVILAFTLLSMGFAVFIWGYVAGAKDTQRIMKYHLDSLKKWDNTMASPEGEM